MHFLQQALQIHLPYDDKHDQGVSHQANNKDHWVDSGDDDGDGGGDAGVVVLGVPKGPGGIALIVRPAQDPAAAGAGGTTGPRGAGGVRLLTENLYRGIHRGTAPSGGKETERREKRAGGEYAGKREEREKKKNQKHYYSHQTLRPLKSVDIKRSSAVVGTVIHHTQT